jgi:hypothetical protein
VREEERNTSVVKPVPKMGAIDEVNNYCQNNFPL